MDLSPTREQAQVGSNLNPLASYITVYHLTPKIMHKGAFCLMSYTFRKKKTNWLEILIFPALLILFYVLEIFYLKPVDGINDDWGCTAPYPEPTPAHRMPMSCFFSIRCLFFCASFIVSVLLFHGSPFFNMESRS